MSKSSAKQKNLCFSSDESVRQDKSSRYAICALFMLIGIFSQF